MKRVEKKVWPEYFEQVLSGNKTYELRLGDFECNPGDTLVLREWNQQTKQYTGRQIEKTITYVGKFRVDQLFWSEENIKKHGLQIISFK